MFYPLQLFFLKQITRYSDHPFSPRIGWMSPAGGERVSLIFNPVTFIFNLSTPRYKKSQRRLIPIYQPGIISTYTHEYI